MADVTTEHLLRYAIHDSTSQVLTEPSNSKVCIIPETPTLFRPTPEFMEIDRTGQMLPNGEHIPNIRGIYNRNIGGLDVEVHGLSAGGAGDGVEAATLSSHVFPIISTLLGAEATVGTPTGDTTDALDAGTGTTVTVDTSAADFGTTGSGLLVQGTTSGSNIAREVTNRSGADLSIERALTDDTGAADSADEGVTVYAARTAYFDNDLTERSHIAFFSEHDNNSREYLGCMPSSAQLRLNPEGQVILQLGGISASKVNPTLTSGAGSYSAPTTGYPIVCAPMILHIGSTRYVASNFAFDFGLRRSDRPGPGPLNMLGYVMRSAQPRLSCRILHGTLTAPQEMTQALRASAEGANQFSTNTVDVSLQIGNQPGSCMYIRMPAARVAISDADADGLHGVDVTFLATESGNHANAPGSCRIHIF